MSDLQVGCIYTGHMIATILTKCRVQHCFEEKCIRHLLPSPSRPAAYSISIWCNHWTPTHRVHKCTQRARALVDHKHKHCTALHCTASVYTLAHMRNGGGTDHSLDYSQLPNNLSWSAESRGLALQVWHNNHLIPNIMRKMSHKCKFVCFFVMLMSWEDFLKSQGANIQGANQILLK